LPTFPASSPFVTAVGGTAATASGPTASAVFPSGGGFSNLFPQPAYQAIPVAQYLAKGAAVKLPSGTLFNSSGKAAAYPDVALLAENFVLSQYKVPVPVSGTSCSTPAFAALVALLNSERLAAGKPSLGYLNPLLYANPGAFTDVVKGSNPGCAVNPSVGYLGTGFECAAGWDPLTGLGTPLFKKWQAIVSALP
jgi:tripeptidyl-peptidase-1|tara:strand:+ start:136 stop:717 length:582 start_codon:yes stop_codon:yes gene_type:complete